jgi:hypothetical protein
MPVRGQTPHLVVLPVGSAQSLYFLCPVGCLSLSDHEQDGKALHGLRYIIRCLSLSDQEQEGAPSAAEGSVAYFCGLSKEEPVDREQIQRLTKEEISRRIQEGVKAVI